MNKKRLKVLFAGAAEFAIPSLEALLQSESIDLVGLLTQPDRRVGRKQELRATPVKQFLLDSEWAEKVPVFAPENLSKEAEGVLVTTSPDLLVVAAYGQFIPNSMLTQPPFGAINIHGSLLPELRGAVPVQMAILQGLKKTGVTIQRMVQQMDAGNILGKKEILLSGDETTAVLMPKLGILGAELLLEVLPKLVTGEIEEEVQNEDLATFCYQKDIAKENAEITARTTVDLAERMVRAFNPWPVAWFRLPEKSGSYSGKRVKIFSAGIVEPDFGQLSNNSDIYSDNTLNIMSESGRLFINLADGLLELFEIQLEGKKRKPAKEYLWLVGE